MAAYGTGTCRMAPHGLTGVEEGGRGVDGCSGLDDVIKQLGIVGTR